MRMILVALPCLLFSGLVLAKEAPKAAPKPASKAAAAPVTTAADSKRFNMRSRCCSRWPATFRVPMPA